MRFRFIEDRRVDYPVRVMCAVLGVSPAGYYAWRSRPSSQRSIVNRDLLSEVRRVHRDNRGRYGSPRIHAELRDRGVSRGRIERLMRRHGIRAITARAWHPRTTDSRHDLPTAPNLIDRNFTAAAPNQVWLADITYIRTDQGWLYLAAVMDLYSRKIVGYAMDDHLRTELPLAALRNGVEGSAPGRRPDPSLRPWRPICLGRLSQDLAVRPRQGFDEPQGRLLRQCTDGKLFPHAQDRARPSPSLCNTSGG